MVDITVSNDKMSRRSSFTASRRKKLGEFKQVFFGAESMTHIQAVTWECDIDRLLLTSRDSQPCLLQVTFFSLRLNSKVQQKINKLIEGYLHRPLTPKYLKRSIHWQTFS